VHEKQRPMRASLLVQGAELLDRRDMMYVATGGSEGEEPGFTSVALPYAGMLVMRSGWDKDARYLAFDAGPFGAGHQHEDKLGFELAAYDRTFIVDPGRYSYAATPYRGYFLGPHSHSTIRIDGMGQNRRAKGATHSNVVSEPLPHVWVSTPLVDYAEGTYDEGYGAQREVDCVHRRGIVFVNPDYWVIADAVEGAGTRHIESLFQFTPGEMRVAHGSGDIATADASGPNLRLNAFSPGNELKLSFVEGQTSPVQGWFSQGYGVKVPSPTAIVSTRATLPLSLAYTLAPAPAGTEPARGESIAVESGRSTIMPDPVCAAIGDAQVMVDLTTGTREKKWADVATDARVVCIRRAGDQVSALSVIGGGRLKIATDFDLQVAGTGTTATCEITYGSDAVTVNSPADATLRFPLQGRRAIVLNGEMHSAPEEARAAIVDKAAVRFE
jgi:hypothetical protein